MLLSLFISMRLVPFTSSILLSLFNVGVPILFVFTLPTLSTIKFLTLSTFLFQDLFTSIITITHVLLTSIIIIQYRVIFRSQFLLI